MHPFRQSVLYAVCLCIFLAFGDLISLYRYRVIGTLLGSNSSVTSAFIFYTRLLLFRASMSDDIVIELLNRSFVFSDSGFVIGYLLLLSGYMVMIGIALTSRYNWLDPVYRATRRLWVRSASSTFRRSFI